MGCSKPGMATAMEKQVQNRGELGPLGSTNKSQGIFALDRGFLAQGGDPSPSAGLCQAALISPSIEDNACLGRGPLGDFSPGLSAGGFLCFALYCYQMLFVQLARRRSPS